MSSAGLGGALAVSVTIGTKVCAVPSDPVSKGKSHIVVYTKFTLAVTTTPATLALADAAEGAFAVSLGDLNFGANPVSGDVSWTPPLDDANTKIYGPDLATDAAGSAGALGGGTGVGTKVRQARATPTAQASLPSWGTPSPRGVSRRCQLLWR